MILLDTCVLSELAKAAPAPAVATWIAGVPDDSLFISVITLGEIQKGAALLDPGPRRERIEAWLEGLQRDFGDRILPIDAAVARAWGALSAANQRDARQRPPVDGLLAATAIAHGFRLATRNVADFEGTGARLINPWSPGRPLSRPTEQAHSS